MKQEDLIPGNLYFYLHPPSTPYLIKYRDIKDVKVSIDGYMNADVKNYLPASPNFTTTKSFLENSRPATKEEIAIWNEHSTDKIIEPIEYQLFN